MRSIRQLLFSLLAIVYVSCITQVNGFIAERSRSGRWTNLKSIHYKKSHRPKLSPSRRLRASSQDDDAKTTTAKVRFSGIDLDKTDDNMAATMNPIDVALSWFTSDVGSIVLGVVGLLLLLVGRLILDNDITSDVESMGQETRVNLLAALATGAVLVNGVSKLDVESALAETVTLQGAALSEPVIVDSAKDTSSDTEWALQSLLTATPAKTGVLLDTQESGSWKITAMAGIVPSVDPSLLQIPLTTPVLDRFQKTDTKSETYLPTLQALPGRTEFTYLPANTQAVLLVPVDDSAVLVLGSNQARSFTPRNIAWCQTVAMRLATNLSEKR